MALPRKQVPEMRHLGLSRAPESKSAGLDQRTALIERVYELLIKALMDGSTMRYAAEFIADELIADRSAAEAFPEFFESSF